MLTPIIPKYLQCKCCGNKFTVNNNKYSEFNQYCSRKCLDGYLQYRRRHIGATKPIAEKPRIKRERITSLSIEEAIAASERKYQEMYCKEKTKGD